MVDTVATNQRRMRLGIIAALTALSCLGTLIIRIPIPATTGYFNIGDIFVILAGLWLGPRAGLIVGAVGPTLADLIGFPVFVPATLIIKGLEGLMAGALGGSNLASAGRKILAASTASILMVAGYFIFEAFIYPFIGRSVPAFAITTVGAAFIEILPNTVQAVIGAAGGVGIWRTISEIKTIE